MFKNLLTIILCCIGILANSQEMDPNLIRIKTKMERIKGYSAKLELKVNIPFIQMPTKTANIEYSDAKGTNIESDDFIMLPKKGLDFTFDELFKYPFVSIDQGIKNINDKKLKAYKIVPTTDESPIAVASLWIDPVAEQILFAEVTTRDNGSYDVEMNFNNAKDVLPASIKIGFKIERLKIPLNFMGSDTKIDRKMMRNSDVKKGEIFISLHEVETQLK